MNNLTTNFYPNIGLNLIGWHIYDTKLFDIRIASLMEIIVQAPGQLGTQEKSASFRNLTTKWNVMETDIRLLNLGSANNWVNMVKTNFTNVSMETNVHVKEAMKELSVWPKAYASQFVRLEIHARTMESVLTRKILTTNVFVNMAMVENIVNYSLVRFSLYV